MMAQSILLLEYNGLPKVKVTVASNISLAKLKELAAEKFSISCQPVTLEYVDKDFDEWVAVDDTYQLPNKGKLRVSILAIANNVLMTVPESPKAKWVPYCTKAVSVEQTDSQNGVSRPSGAAGAWMQTDKKWGQRDNPLKIHFLNPDVLEDENWMCGEGQMNIDNILAWARRWNNKAFPDIPNFGFTNSAEKAHIRVNFGNGGCWSKIGTDARTVGEAEPTMNLSLKGLDPDFQEYLVIHEFGHALGLEHEHQRSDFWEVLKDFIDLEKMKADPELKKVDLDVDMLVKPPSGDTSVYDPESVMHYWFNVNWLKDKKHWTLEGVKADKNLTPGSKEMKVLEGIHKRNRSFRVDGPSKLDQEFLQKCYGSAESETPASLDTQPPMTETPTETPGIVLNVNTHLRHVKNALLDAAYKWNEIGQALDITPGTLRSIGRQFRGNDNECLNEVLTRWMHTGEATIDQLFEALEDDDVKRGDIVKQIKARQGEQRSKVGLA